MKMKKLILLTFVVLFAATNTYCQKNKAYVQQKTNYNSAKIYQTSAKDVVHLLQNGGIDNNAHIKQSAKSKAGGTNQRANIRQTGSYNNTKVVSKGKTNKIHLEQVGDRNYSSIKATNGARNGNRISLTQKGDYNNAVITARGKNTKVEAVQRGFSNKIGYEGSGNRMDHRGDLLQNGNYNKINVTQKGSYNKINAAQRGNHNRLVTLQKNSSNTINTLQRGNHNFAKIRQN